MLALQLGMTVADLSERLTAAEEAYWIAYHKEHPFDGERMDVALGQIAQLIHNANSKKPRKLVEFLPFYRKRVQVDQSVDDILKSHLSRGK